MVDAVQAGSLYRNKTGAQKGRSFSHGEKDRMRAMEFNLDSA